MDLIDQEAQQFEAWMAAPGDQTYQEYLETRPVYGLGLRSLEAGEQTGRLQQEIFNQAIGGLGNLTVRDNLARALEIAPEHIQHWRRTMEGWQVTLGNGDTRQLHVSYRDLEAASIQGLPTAVRAWAGLEQGLLGGASYLLGGPALLAGIGSLLLRRRTW